MNDLYNVIEGVVEGRNYAGEVKSNVMAATQGRLKILRMGSLGYMFGAERNPDLDDLFKQPVILELNDLNLDDKALVMMFLLTLLREYREQNPSRSSLEHVTVVEEAHNILAKAESQGNVDGGGADTKAKSVEAFCNMLAEVRALGEGLIIADQSPNKLAPDAMRNTNVQIAHQLRDGNDREAIANAMIMDEEQRDFLGKLETGRAAVFYTGLQKASFIQMPQYSPSKLDKKRYNESDLRAKFPGYGFREDDNEVSDYELSKYMDLLTRKYRKPVLPFSSCEHCESQCRYRKDILCLMDDKELQAKFEHVYQLSCRTSEEVEGIDLMAEFVKVCQAATSLIDSSNAVDAGWCFLTHMWATRRPEGAYLPNSTRNSFKKKFRILINLNWRNH
jgi:hypothetical protein